MMLRFCSLFVALFLSGALFAQTPDWTPPSDVEMRQTTEQLTAKYSLNADQAKQMYRIQVRKSRNMSQIADLQQRDPDLYLAKVKNVQEGTWASIRRILQTKEQVALYQKTQSELRVARGVKRKALAAQKANKNAIETAVLNIYAE